MEGSYGASRWQLVEGNERAYFFIKNAENMFAAFLYIGEKFRIADVLSLITTNVDVSMSYSD